jgi:hydroxyacylglutathione hydrolase
MQVITIELASLGNRAYLVHDGRAALAVDPPRDVATVEEAASAAGVDIVAVADTHVHHDYLSGALLLARRHGADYLLSGRERVGFERVGVGPGDHVSVGELDVEVIATPGHTRHHQAFLVRRPGTGEPGALFTGGSLLDGAVGRTDLVDPELTRQLARAQWSSVRTLATLDSRTHVYPTHGVNSPCASGPLANSHDKERFVTDLVSGTGPIPTHYAHLSHLNRRGAGTPLPARRATAEDVSDAVLAGAWVIDLRSRAAYAEGHLPGSVSLEYSDQFATYAGWLVPWGDDVVLLTDTAEVLEPALRDLARIGIDGVEAHVLTGDDTLSATYRRSDWAGFREAARVSQPILIDVRQLDEWAAGHLPGALHLPVQDVEQAAARLPRGELWVHCRSGYRAGIAASLLHRMGHAVVHIDDTWDHVSEQPVVSTSAAA